MEHMKEILEVSEGIILGGRDTLTWSQGQRSETNNGLQGWEYTNLQNVCNYKNGVGGQSGVFSRKGEYKKQNSLQWQ